MKHFITKYSEFIILFLFAFVGVFSAGSYGFAWDEYVQREIGQVCLNYILHNDLYFLSYNARDHGAFFELFLLAIEKISGITSTKDIYTQRHLVTHLFFLLSAYYFFKLIVLLYNKKSLALIGMLLLLANPIIYGHSFFNSKDVPFLSLLIICFYQFALSFRDKKLYQFFVLAILTSALINIRIMGILFMLFVFCFIIFDFIIYIKNKNLQKKHLFILTTYLLFTVVFTVIEYPLLWHDTVNNFSYVFNNLSKYPWDGDNLFNGNLIPAKQVSWQYIPTWFCITTPIVYILLGFSGIVLFLISQFKLIKTLNFKAIDKNNALYFLSFLLPILVVIVLKSVLYDTWRHLYYIYPAFILLAIYFINYCSNTHYFKVVYSVTLVSIISIFIYIILNFPFHHVYFNQSVSLRGSQYIRTHYDMDFWGVNFNKSLQYILKNDTSSKIKVYSIFGMANSNSWLLTNKQQKRFVFVDSMYKANYFITNYRWHPQDYTDSNLTEYHSFEVQGSKINTIFKVK